MSCELMNVGGACGRRVRVLRGIVAPVLSIATVVCAAGADVAAAKAKLATASGSAQVSAAASLRIARSMRNSGNAATAVPIYRELAAGLPADAPLKIELGEALLEARLIDEAIGLFNAAPASARAQLGLARAQLELGQPAKALVFADRAEHISPTDTAVLNVRGVVLDRLGRHGEAQTCYRGVIALTPSSVAARSNLALSLALIGQFPEALDILEPIARSANATARDRQNLAFIYGLKGDSATARALGEVDLDPKTAAANTAFLALAHDQLSEAN